MDEFIHWPKPYLPKLQGMTSNIGLTFNVGDTLPRFTISMSKTTEIGDTKYHIKCSKHN